MEQAVTFECSAKWYDALYAGKDYDREIANYRKALGEDFAPRSIVDVGCGTGNSTLALRRAFPEATITAVDPNREMREMAHAKGVEAIDADLQTFQCANADLVVCFFNVIGYAGVDLTSLIPALKNAHKQTNENGVLLFDFMHMPTVARSLRPVECRHCDCGEYKIFRTAFREYLGLLGIVEYVLKYEVWQCGSFCDYQHETHRMRCFTITELTLLLSLTGWHANFFSCDGNPRPRPDEFYLLCKATKNGTA